MIPSPATRKNFRPAAARSVLRLPSPWGRPMAGSGLEEYGQADPAYYCAQAQSESAKWLKRLDKLNLYPNADQRYADALEWETQKCGGDLTSRDMTTSAANSEWQQQQAADRAIAKAKSEDAAIRRAAARDAAALAAAGAFAGKKVKYLTGGTVVGAVFLLAAAWALWPRRRA